MLTIALECYEIHRSDLSSVRRYQLRLPLSSLAWLIAILTCLSYGETSANAQTVEYNFAGPIFQINAPSGVMPPWIHEGSPVFGNISWETNLSDTNPDTILGEYYSPLGSLDLTVGSGPVVYIPSEGGLNLFVNSEDSGGCCDATFELDSNSVSPTLLGSMAVADQIGLFATNNFFPSDAVPASIDLTNDVAVVVSGHATGSGLPIEIIALLTNLNQISTVAGDFNHDGSFDAADYVVWRKTGVDGSQGYEEWRSHFGQTTLGRGSLFDDSSAVPEPATFVLVLMGLLYWKTACPLRGDAQNRITPVLCFTASFHSQSI